MAGGKHDEYDESAITRALRAPGTPAELGDEATYVAMFREARLGAAPVDDGLDESALVSALRAPGTPAELADEATYVAMFREAAVGAAPLAAVGGTRRPARRAARRLGTSTTLAATFAIATAGVAAAYSTNLPDPVQAAVHSVLAPLGVPAAESQRHVTAQKAPAPEKTPDPAPAATPTAAPTKKPSAAPSKHPSSTPSASATIDPAATDTPEVSGSPSPSESPSASETATVPPLESPSVVPATAGPTDSPSPSSSPSPSESVTPTTPPPPTPARASITSAGANQKVAPGGTAVVTGRVAAEDGAPIADQEVVLQQYGPNGWRRVAVALTAADGSISVATGPVDRTTKVRLRAGTVSSAAWRIVVQSSVTATAQTTNNVAVVTAAALGGQPGDPVVLLARRDGVLVEDARAPLDGRGNVRFRLTAPTADRVYVVRLLESVDHAASRTQVTVKPQAQ